MRTPFVGTKGIRARAIAGMHTVLLAFDVEPAARAGLLGFAIKRESPTDAEWLKGIKVFESVIPKPAKGGRYSTRHHPIQSLLWGDYTTDPGTAYTYCIRPVYGKPDKLEYSDDVVVNVITEREIDPKSVHQVYFNRGVVASQAYAAKYQNEAPPEPNNPDHEQTQWLSRGLLRACLRFIHDTQPGEALHVAAYEFTYPPILEALKEATKRKVDVQIIFEAGKVKEKDKVVVTSTTKGNLKAIKATKFAAATKFIPRTHRKAIPHNKFMVRVNAGAATAVWTGSTNFTESGFLGQTNVGHQINDSTTAGTFLEYWKLLANDPEADVLEPALDALTPDPGATLQDNTTTCVFSPRAKATLLDWYASRIRGANSCVMFTGGFGVTEKLAPAFAEDKDFLRFLLLEKPPTQKTKAALGNDHDLLIVYGNVLGEIWAANAKGELTLRRKIPGFELEKWFLEEELFRKTGHIFFVHTKILIIDALSDDPLVFTGSANFSPPSLTSNDENMLLIRGETRVADIYLTEFDRILRHFYFRNVAAELHGDGDDSARFLGENDDWLDPYVNGKGLKNRRRGMFFPPVATPSPSPVPPSPTPFAPPA